MDGGQKIGQCNVSYEKTIRELPALEICFADGGQAGNQFAAQIGYIYRKEKRMNRLNTIKKFARNVTWKIQQKVYYGIQVLRGDSGMSVIELLLILVVIIALILIFKDKLTDLVNTIFEKITSESGRI